MTQNLRKYLFSLLKHIFFKAKIGKYSLIDYPNTNKLRLILALYIPLGKSSLSCLFISMPRRQPVLIFALLSADPFTLMLVCLQKLMLLLSASHSSEHGVLYYRTQCAHCDFFLMWRCCQNVKKSPTAFKYINVIVTLVPRPRAYTSHYIKFSYSL